MNRLFSFFKKTLFVFTIALVLATGFSPAAVADNIKTIAVLPFEVNSPDDISHIKNGLVSMLHSRLFWKDRVNVVKKGTINKTLAQNQEENKNDLIKDIADATGADYVLTGTITQFAGSFSLDAKVIDVKNNQQLTFFEQAKQIDNVIPKLDRIAGKINKKVFDRTTIAWDEYEKEQDQAKEDSQRTDPEMMMPFPQGESEKTPPVWKFWEYML